MSMATSSAKVAAPPVNDSEVHSPYRSFVAGIFSGVSKLTGLLHAVCWPSGARPLTD